MTDITPDPDDRRCTAVKPDGTRCKSWAMRDESGLCAGHAGRGLAADPRTYAAKGRASQRARAAERREKAQTARMGLRERLVHEAAEQQDALVRALFAPLAEEGAEAHHAAIRILERMLGRPGEGMADLETNQPRSLDELVAALDAITGLDEVGTPVVPDEAQALDSSLPQG